MGKLFCGIRGNLRGCLAVILGCELLLAIVAPPVRSATVAYYVATTGSDGNPGTSLSAPFRTIQKCAGVAQAGDTCFIRGGVYRETVTPAHSGTSSAPITFKAYNGEAVTLSGANVITGWTPHSGRIYRASMSWSLDVRTPDQVTNNQIFVDGKMMVEARWPNISPDRVASQKNSDKARADSATDISQYAATYQDAALGAVPNGLFDGGKITFGPGTNIVHTSCDVVSQTGSLVSFRCNSDPAAWGAQSDLTSQGDMLRPKGGNYYYLWGELGALDAPGEWFREADGSLYLWTPDSSAPTGHLVEAKRRLWAFDLTNRHYIVLDDLRVFAAGIKYGDGTSHTTVQNALIEYPWHFQELPVMFYTNGTTGLRVLGSYNTIRDSTLAYSPGGMITLVGTDHRVTNDVIYNAGYMGVGAAIAGANAAEPQNPGGAASNEATQNAIFDVGRLAVSADAGLDITYNDLYQSHLQISDLATIYGIDMDGKGARIAYNLVHDNRAELNENLEYWGGHGIFLDDNTYNYKVYRNITWNTTSPGIFAFGTQNAPSNRLFYHNTVVGTLRAMAKSGQTMAGTEFKNNIGDVLELSGPALVTSHNYAGDARFVDRAARDYQLRQDAPAVDTGLTLGSPYTDAPMLPVGAPDIGALERGRVPFKAGALLRHMDLAGLAIECSADADAPTASCQLGGLPLGRQLPADFELAIGNTGAPVRTCVTRMDYATHRATASCLDVPTGGLTGVQPVWVRLGGGSWVEARGAADLRGLAIVSVSPASGVTRGGTRVTLTGRRFDTSLAGWKVPVTISNPGDISLLDYQVLVRLNTASLISQGKMRADCRDISFYDEYGELNFWLEDGCNTANTRFWVKTGYLPQGETVITLAYGYGGQTRTSDGRSTFAFFDDFEDGVASPYWTLGKDEFYTAQERNGKMVLLGAATSPDRYGGAIFYLNNWLIPYPQDFAIDSELSVINGTNNFKASLGTPSDVLAVQGEPIGNPSGKTIGYFDGGNWVLVGKSTVSRATFSDHKFSVAFSGPASSRTIRWMEDGDLGRVLATRADQDNPVAGLFMYSPDNVASFDARFDNVRVRNYVYPEPEVTLGTERASGVRITFGGAACLDIEVTEPTIAQCTTPPHTQGAVGVSVVNPDGHSASLDHAFTYTTGWLAFLPFVSHQ